MLKSLIVAMREFRSTALTKAFVFGAVVFPLVIWGAMLGVSAIDFKKPPLKGTVVVVDQTKDGKLGKALAQFYDPEFQEQQAAQAKALIEAASKQIEKMGMPEAQARQGAELGAEMQGLSVTPAEIKVEVVPADTSDDVLKSRTRSGEVMAALKLDERTMALDATLFLSQVPTADTEAQEDAERDLQKTLREKGGPGTYEFIQGTGLRPDHARMLRSAVERIVKDERYRRNGVEPLTVKTLSQLPVVARSTVVTETGERKSNDGLTAIMPFIFMMLIYIAAMTGGNYLFYGTLEEKSSRVMEVVLSAVSARQLLVGKLIGQGLVGLAVMAVYAGLGFAAARHFGIVQQLPMHLVPWLLVYFVIAYCLIGSLNLAVGSAVTEIREAQALYTPVIILVMLPFLLMIPIMQNPGSMIAKIFSYFPPTTPYVMVMRLSQPSHVIPLWELIATTMVGMVGVVVSVWAAAKVFRVGVLMYGKPPSLLGLLKWIRQA